MWDALGWFRVSGVVDFELRVVDAAIEVRWSFVLWEWL
jgi:hypothetical protein